jgi:hypothetical protein
MIKTMSMPTKQPEEVDDASVAPGERGVEFAWIVANSKSWKS